jgi:hypothetical protein
MSTMLYGYIGRDNVERLALLQDGVAVTAGAVTKAMLKFGGLCIDTENNSDQIYFADSDNQTVCMKLGQVDDIVEGDWEGALTIFDAEADDGLAWAKPIVSIQSWDVCPET